jgi:hypothetical protein
LCVGDLVGPESTEPKQPPALPFGEVGCGSQALPGFPIGVHAIVTADAEDVSSKSDSTRLTQSNGISISYCAESRTTQNRAEIEGLFHVDRERVSPLWDGKTALASGPMPLPIQFLLFLLIGWVSREQQDVIEYLKAENRALLEPRREAASIHRRAASTTRAKGKATRKTTATRTLADRHPGHVAALVPRARRSEV